MMNRPPRRTRHIPRHPSRPATRPRRLAVAAPGLALITIATLVALAGCSGSASSGSSAANSAPASIPSAVASASAAPAAGVASGAGFAQSASAARIVAASQQLIYTASLTVRSSSVGAAIARATAIAVGEGGYVASENASNDPGHPAQSTATVELKIPVALYSAALHDLTQPSLGTQLSLTQQAQDVTEQVADVSSRVISDEAAISQLRALLRHAGTVGDLLSVQDQINAEETALEAMQAQQTALNHQTAYATVTLTVIGPEAAPKPARAPHTPDLVNGLVGGWHAFRTAVSWLLAILGAVAPFAAAIAVLGGLALLIRRRLTRRDRGTGAPAASSPADS